MKQIKKSDIEKKIRSEYREGKKWIQCGRGRYFVMMIDLDDGEIWSDCMEESNWKCYHSDSIHMMDVEYSAYDYVKAAIQMLLRSGWEVVDE